MLRPEDATTRQSERRLGKCWLTKKVCFGSQAIALDAGAANDPALPWRAYRCNYCGTWHLSTKP